MSDNKRNRSSKGYYIALILCAAAIWITGYVFYRNTGETQEISMEETYEDILVGTLETEDVAVIATEPQTRSTEPSATGQTTPPSVQKKSMKTVSPVSGEFGHGGGYGSVKAGGSIQSGAHGGAALMSSPRDA